MQYKKFKTVIPGINISEDVYNDLQSYCLYLGNKIGYRISRSSIWKKAEKEFLNGKGFNSLDDFFNSQEFEISKSEVFESIIVNHMKRNLV